MAIFDECPLFLDKQWSHLLFIDLLNICSKHFFELRCEIALQFRRDLVESKVANGNIVGSPLNFYNAETINHSLTRSVVLEYLDESIMVYLERCES